MSVRRMPNQITRFALAAGLMMLTSWAIRPAGAAIAPLEWEPAHPEPRARTLPVIDAHSQSWIVEPVWLRQPTFGRIVESVPDIRPEPIPLPPAAVAVGPMLLTTLMAGAFIKSRRRRRWLARRSR